ncbi:GxxExxY protein [Sphingomonas sp. HMP6]|uniref:GxxExxY protein n=1 Tax=Sphingomonas sp. HMP6 TaxID=1517551 RepID=UPI0015964E22|nr:GxxExxY protein [Sphingomonas sp. HMP6]BCA59669.1 Fe3+ hydroxamate ABC transporter substrate-binding protein [Sphingomonas sp. HMP6]
MDVEHIASIAVDCGIKLHQRVGPGLLESAYEIVLAHALEARGLTVERQKIIPIVIDGILIENGFRADLLVENALLIELKSIDRLSAVHAKQVLTYLRFLELPLDLLMNFGGETFKEGLRRVVNRHGTLEGSALRIHKPLR